MAESDLCPFKPCCDVILNATAHAPAGHPMRTFPVRLYLQVLGAAPSTPALVDKTLHITGASHIRSRKALFRLAWWTLKWGTLWTEETFEILDILFSAVDAYCSDPEGAFADSAQTISTAGSSTPRPGMSPIRPGSGLAGGGADRTDLVGPPVASGSRTPDIPLGN
jgi:hypothetical protein